MAILTEKKLPSMTDYFVLFSEPEGPEGLRLYKIKKSKLKAGVNVTNDLDEMTLAADAFDEVEGRDKAGKSFYLACLQKKYANRLPNNCNVNLVRSLDANSKMVAITILINKSRWKFIFSEGEKLPDSIVAPDGVILGDMNQDSCVTGR